MLIAHRLLTKKEERTLSRKGAPGRKSLVEHNLRLVAYLSKPFQHQGISPDDLFQEGSLGLMRAARTFDPKRGRFTTYATWWVRQYMQLAVKRHQRHQDFEQLEDAPDRSHPSPPEGLAEALDDALNVLPKRTRSILKARYLLPNKTKSPHDPTLKSVGRQFHLSRERIRQIEQESFAKLSHNPSLQEYATP